MTDKEKLESNDNETITLTKDELNNMLSQARNDAISEINNVENNSINEEDDDGLEYLDDFILESPKKKKSWLKKFGPFLVFLLILFIGFIGINIYRANRTIMPKDHVYVCDNPKQLSDFDNWIRDDVGIKWVPTYIIVQDGYIIGAFNGDIEEIEFSSKLGTALALNMQITPMEDFEISNLAGERKPASEAFGQGLCIIELVWIDCPDCQHQDENYTNDIYQKYSTKNFYRYYIKSEYKDVLNKYK